MDINVFIAFIGGIITFISPCILPMVPIYISYISGLSVKEMQGNKKPMGRVIGYTLMFVLGFTVIFSILAVVFNLLLNSFQDRAIAGPLKIGLNIFFGVLLFIFALQTMHIINIPFLNYELKYDPGKKRPSLLSSFILGLAFGGGWTPCMGPILSGILYTSTGGRGPLDAALLLIFFSMGIGIPFILTGIATNSLMGVFNFIKKHYRGVEIISGIFLIILAILITFDLTGVISGWFSKLFPGLAEFQSGLESHLTGDSGSTIGSVFTDLIRSVTQLSNH